MTLLFNLYKSTALSCFLIQIIQSFVNFKFKSLYTKIFYLYKSYPLEHLTPGLSFKNMGKYLVKSSSEGLPSGKVFTGHTELKLELTENKDYNSNFK